MAYAEDLIRFISNIPTLADGTIPVSPNFQSEMYEPVYSLSTVARLVQSELKSGKIEVENEELEPETVVYKALNSDLGSYAPDIYMLLRATVLEAFSLLYTIDNEFWNLQYVSHSDIRKARTNLNFISDYLSTEQKYYSLIEVLRDMNISFGYLENQIDVILNERGRR